MTFKSWQKRKTLNVRLLQPELPVCASTLEALLSQIIAVYFPEITITPPVFFGRTPTLAYIEDAGNAQRSVIWIHHALNDPVTPPYVFAHVLKHELLHTRVRPKVVDGKWSAHPPEFWEEEGRLSAEDRGLAWQWIITTFEDALKTDIKNECMWVNNKRMKELLHDRQFAEQDRKHFYAGFELKHKELRFGFRERAKRDFEPEKDF